MATAHAKRGTRPQGDPEASSHSGRLLLRMSPSLHAELAQAADKDGQSLNAYITGVLSDQMNGRRPKPPPAPRSAGRLVRAAVIADLVLVAVAAALAIALLLVAWP